MVSILIVLDYVLLLEQGFGPIEPLKMFQSLLYWIMYYYIFQEVILKKLHGSFNPYCIGLCITIINWDITQPNPITFQSLLYWIMYYYSFNDIQNPPN